MPQALTELVRQGWWPRYTPATPPCQQPLISLAILLLPKILLSGCLLLVETASNSSALQAIFHIAVTPVVTVLIGEQ